MGIGLIALLLPEVAAGAVDPKVERLERLERALQIEDCEYASGRTGAFKCLL